LRRRVVPNVELIRGRWQHFVSFSACVSGYPEMTGVPGVDRPIGHAWAHHPPWPPLLRNSAHDDQITVITSDPDDIRLVAGDKNITVAAI
jgi:hypothetical protein